MWILYPEIVKTHGTSTVALQKDKPRDTRQYYYRIQHRSKTNEYLTLLIVSIQSKKNQKAVIQIFNDQHSSKQPEKPIVSLPAFKTYTALFPDISIFRGLRNVEAVSNWKNLIILNG